MKKISCIILIMFVAASGSHFSQAFAQTNPPETIFDSLNEPGAGKGAVTIRQETAVRQMVGRRLSGDKVEKNADQSFLKVDGFRAQVFSGNDQRKSKDEAAQKEKLIKELFPDVPTYVIYTAPFWRLRVGDFSSREEALQMQRQLMGAFPTFAKEMYIVKDEVKIPL